MSDRDLAAQIREKLAVYTGFAAHVHGEEVFAPLVDAILAVVDEHGPHLDDPEKCRCIEYDDVYVANLHPDRTLRAIAEKLGIEVDRG